MCPALCHPIEDMTLRLCWKRSQKPKFLFLLLDAGPMPVWYEAMELISLGACTTPNISEQHSDAGACFLSLLLQENVPDKYSLSPKSLRRYFEAGGTPRQAASLHAAKCAGATDAGIDGYNGAITGEKAAYAWSKLRHVHWSERSASIQRY